MDEKLKAILANAYYVGGSPCSGKSTVTAYLAKKHSLTYYKIDDYEREHMDNLDPLEHPIMYKWSQMSWDEIWMRSVETQVEEEFQFYRERFGMILNDMNKFSKSDTLITEGAALIPELIHKLGVDRKKVIYMIPSKEFQIEYYSKRGFIAGILANCTEPEKAFENWMERDHRFGKKVKSQAKELGYLVIDVDGHKPIDEIIELVSKYFDLQ